MRPMKSARALGGPQVAQLGRPEPREPVGAPSGRTPRRSVSSLKHPAPERVVLDPAGPPRRGPSSRWPWRRFDHRPPRPHPGPRVADEAEGPVRRQLGLPVQGGAAGARAWRPAGPASFSAPGSRSSSTDCTVLPPVFCTCTNSTRAGCDTITALTLALRPGRGPDLPARRRRHEGRDHVAARLPGRLAAVPAGVPQGVPRLRQPRPGQGAVPAAAGWSPRRTPRSTRSARAGRPTRPTCTQAAMIADEELYFDYFTALFARGRRRPG